MATRYWISKGDGARIPHHTDKEAREQWDKGYYDSLVRVFANGDPNRLKPVTVPVDARFLGHTVREQPGYGGRNRVPLYRRMLAGGDRLPPLVVRRNGNDWHVTDGNARLTAALRHGKLKEMQAYELVDPPKPPEQKTSKTNGKVPKLKKDESDYSEVHPDVFEQHIAKVPDQSTLSNPRDYNGTRTFLAHDKLSGYGLKNGNELVSVFSLQPGHGNKAVQHALGNGAEHLDAFDGHLPKWYAKHGFREYKRSPNWTAGGPDVVYMSRSGQAPT